MTDPPGSAADIMALLNSNAKDHMIKVGNDTVAGQFGAIASGLPMTGQNGSGTSTPPPVYQSLFSDPYSMVDGVLTGNLLFDANLMNDYIGAVQPQIASFNDKFNVTPPAHPLPRNFSTGAVSSPPSGYPGGYGSPPPNPNYISGPDGWASFDPNSHQGSARGYFSVVTPANGAQPFESLFGSGTFDTNQGSNGGPKTGLQMGWLRLYQNGDRDSLATNLTLDGANLNGNFTVSTRRGPLTLAGNILFTNSTVLSADTSIDYVTPEEQFHLTYRNSMYPGPHQHLDMSYVNQRVDNVTLVSDFVYDSSYGMKSAAGVEVWLSDRDYIESVVTHSQPINGNDYVSMFTRGAMKSRFNPNQSFVFDYALLNGTADPNAMLNLTPYLEVPTQSPLSWRLLFLQDYASWKNATPGIGINYRF